MEEKRIYQVFGLLFLVGISAHQGCQTHMGVKLCYDRCIGLYGCTLYSFSPQHLACCFGNTSAPPPLLGGSVIITINRVDMIVSPNGCQRSLRDRILKSHKNSIKCVQEERTPKKRQPFVGRRLLMVKEEEMEDANFYHILLTRPKHKLHAANYQPIKATLVTDILYNHKTKIVYIAFFGYEGSEIHVFHFNNKSTSLYHKPRSYETMALDEDRNWILFSRRPFDGVCKLHKGKQMFLFATRVLKIKSMAVCSRKELIYAATSKTIFVFSYTGAEDVFYRIADQTPLLVDFTGRYLYFNTQEKPNSCIHQLDTETNKTTCLVKRMRKSTEALVIDSKRIFIKNSYGSLSIYKRVSMRFERSVYFGKKIPYLMCLVDF